MCVLPPAQPHSFIYQSSKYKLDRVVAAQHTYAVMFYKGQFSTVLQLNFGNEPPITNLLDILHCLLSSLTTTPVLIYAP